MRILQVIYSGFGGLGSVGFSLVEADRNREHEWSIAFVGDQAVHEAYPRRCEQDNVSWSEFRSPPGQSWRSWVALARWLVAAKPDAVVVHSIGSILPSRVAAWITGATLVAVEHTANAVKSRRTWVMSRLSMVLADHVVLLTSEYERELADAHGPLFRPDKTVIIPNGIDTSRFMSADVPERPENTVRLGMASRFTSGKRQDVLVGMLKILRERRPTVNWQLDLAGDGDSMDEIRSLAHQLDVAESVRFRGVLSEDGVGSWLRTLDIYVHASDAETLSTSILQAMATSLPIVASDVPGIRNLVVPEIGVVAENSGADFAEKVSALIGDEKLMRKLGGVAREVCVEKYSNIRMLSNYIALF